MITREFLPPNFCLAGWFQIPVLPGCSTELARVFSRELCGTFIAYSECNFGNLGRARPQVVSGLQQAQVLLVLERRRSGHGFELLEERGITHSDPRGQIPDDNGFRQVRLNVARIGMSNSAFFEQFKADNPSAPA